MLTEPTLIPEAAQRALLALLYFLLRLEPLVRFPVPFARAPFPIPTFSPPKSPENRLVAALTPCQSRSNPCPTS